ncbi:MAG TPA: HAMP domain-containing histidine kinase [Candidatus Corynebacterium gallistercoris]|uniref:Sensor histidine kinase MtrB n=1 Tax=Candidatus Corynebacterium gallistercoris TaxID=2838530 RepID=A0A9D1UQE0_9CORY|nr:HAMP domain-containing histidine kinase [Candidatus Corynebacterium gallistercoris]
MLQPEWTVWSVLKDFTRRPAETMRRIGNSIAERWRTSIQMRVIGSVLLSSSIVILLLGFVLISFLSQQLLNTKYNAATEEIDRARIAVEEQIDATDASNPVAVRLTSARAVLADRSGGVDQTNTAVYEPVLIASDASSAETIVPDTATIPAELRNFVQQGQVAYQYTTLSHDHSSYKALIIGTPVSADIPGLELYLVMPLDSEEATLSLMRGLLLAGGIVLLVLLVVIAWVFSQQLTVPVRTASRIAERFAAGHLRERMVVDGKDEVASLAISFNDMAEKLSTQIRNLEEFGSLQRQFTSDVSHELRTPLTTVRMAADLIHDNADNLDPMTRRASELMNKELDRFETLLGDLLEISRHDAGVANLSAEKVDIRGAVRSTLAQVRAIAEEVGTSFNVDLPEEQVQVEIDSRRVERILRNLLANAVDHSEGKPIDVTMAVDDAAVAITVVDDGVGLKPGEAELVFNRFWRSDPSRERRTGGTGLGLAIAKEDALLHGGDLEASGEPGRGSCFRLTLPLIAGTEITSSPLPLEPPAAPDAGVEKERARGGVALEEQDNNEEQP